MLLKDVVVNERELEELIFNAPEIIEEDFTLLINQRRTNSNKRLDVLGMDSKGTLTIVELKVQEDSNQFLQAIDYYDWLLERGLSFFRDLFSNKNISITMPRIILVAPSYTDSTITLAKYISENIQVTLKKYYCFDVNGEKAVKLVDVQIPQIIEPEQMPSKINDHINYITDSNVRGVFENTIEKLNNINGGNTRYTLLPYRINFINKKTGLKFAELYSRRDYFNITWKEGDGWDEERNIKTDEQIDELINTKIISTFKKETD